MSRTCQIALQIVFVALPLPAVVSADDRDVIEYREHIMNTLNEQAAALGMILSTAIPGDNAAGHLQALALTAQTALKAFEPKVLGGEAKPEVWSNWLDFSKRMTEFSQKTAQAAEAAKYKSYDSLGPEIIDALSCKQCHDVYRAEKKK